MKNKRRLFKDSIILRKNLKIIVVIFLCTSILLFSGNQEVKASSWNLHKNNMEFYEDIMNNVISTLKVNSKIEHIDFKKILKLDPLSVLHKELAFFDIKNIKEEFIGKENSEKIVNELDKVEQISINPFNLSDNTITMIENKPTIDVAGNPQDNSKKKILIYHSHTTEAYDVNETRKMDLTQTVAGVGDELAKEFEKLGFTVIHDKSVHDLDYNSAYEKSRETMSKYFSKYGDFDFVVDLHRDAGPAKEYVTTKINNENVARLVIVTTTSDPRYKAHMQNINAIFSVAKEKYPTLFREKNLHTNYNGQRYYNQDLSDNALLLEVGATSNTVQEAKNSMKYVAKVVAEVINQRKK